MSFKESLIPQNQDMREFDPIQKEYLEEYIYALIDPRDNKVFYIGQSKGNSNRVFDHFNEAEDYLNDNTKSLSSKVLRIIDIWLNEEDVEWAIVACRIDKDSNPLDIVESALIDILPLSQNGPALNAISGHHSTYLTKEGVAELAAARINPTQAFETVFIFPVHNSISDGTSVYEATRKYWYVTQANQNIQNAVAIGLSNNISKGVFSIDSWNLNTSNKKHEFNGSELNNDLKNKNWWNIIQKSKGYWQRGNYLIIELDGNGKFRFIRGNPDKGWYDLV